MSYSIFLGADGCGFVGGKTSNGQGCLVGSGFGVFFHFELFLFTPLMTWGLGDGIMAPSSLLHRISSTAVALSFDGIVI
uniref:Uncharacterized protein n=1 Tax=Fagus sylvatica TaxID=28930 RepID=A0A2N9F3R5_FAGSY